jgi:ubiquinone/menaquinone biosynthesis C-methylase UbiE
MGSRHWITKFIGASASLYDSFLRILVNEDAFRKKLLKLAGPEGEETALDIGCGTGSFGLLLAKCLERERVFGLDISPEMLALSKKKAEEEGYRIGYVCGSAAALPYGNEKFDLVFSSLVFHHLDYEEKRKALGEIHRVLRQDGRYVSVEFREFPKDPFHRLFLAFSSSSGILHGLHPPTLIGEAGFEVLEELEGPSMGGHHRSAYRVLGKKRERGSESTLQEA